jgi:hypothetical protein
MKLKILGVLLLVSLMTTSVFAANVTWNALAPGGGSWSNAANWSAVPAQPGVYSDEYKLIRQNSLCTIDSAVGPYNGRLRVSSGINTGADVNASVLNIVNYGSISIAELRAGDQGATNAGSIGKVYQTGGTVNMIASSSGTGSYSRNIILGRCGSSGQAAQGYYTISGGTST